MQANMQIKSKIFARPLYLKVTTVKFKVTKAHNERGIRHENFIRNLQPQFTESA